MYSLTNGRVRQKVRTRNALVEVAAHLIGTRQNFTVADVADLAKVGRTTAYRYFPSLEALKANALLWKLTRIAANNADEILPEDHPIEDRVASLVMMSDRSTLKYEAEQRTMLRLSLEDNADEVPKRSGLRAELVNKAIAGLEKELGRARFERLRWALALFVGIEPMIVLRDVCMLGAEEARDVKLWGAQCLLRCALAEAEAERTAKSNKTGRAGKLNGHKPRRDRSTTTASQGPASR